MEEVVPYSRLMEQALKAGNCSFVCIQDLKFSSLNVDIIEHIMSYEQLMKRLRKTSFSENFEAFLKLITREDEAKIHVTVESTDGDFAEFTLKSEEITEVIPYV